jgi:hypothetical protein
MAFTSSFLAKLHKSRLVEPTIDQTPSITAVLAWSMPPCRSCRQYRVAWRNRQEWLEEKGRIEEKPYANIFILRLRFNVPGRAFGAVVFWGKLDVAISPVG